jgi:hypothetical protein
VSIYGEGETMERKYSATFIEDFTQEEKDLLQKEVDTLPKVDFDFKKLLNNKINKVEICLSFVFKATEQNWPYIHARFVNYLAYMYDEEPTIENSNKRFIEVFTKYCK